jgi:hypothetical protein
MSKEAASADLQAAAYWRNVARTDRAEVTVAVTKVSKLTTAAKRAEDEPKDGPRRARSLSAG